MRPPAVAADELLDRVRRSGLLPPAELDAAVADLPPGADPLAHLLAAGLLTPFQADRIAAGKYRGFRLGGYVVLDKLGAGGMGQVFLAEHVGLRRLVAVKVLAVPADEDATGLERFLREARAAAAVSHPNVVRVFDLNKDGQLNYLVMEYIEGLNLSAWVQARGRLAVGAAADAARQVALGLQHAHERGLVHRDVKPSNIMVDRHGGVRLLDLGLVRITREGDSKLTSGVGGSILGTADYLAPEQAVDSSGVDIRADVYGLAATLYFLLAGHPLFPGGKTAQKLMWQQWRDPTPVRELRPEVPPGLAAALHRALSKKPADRFQTPGEFADALAPFADPAAPPPELVPAPPPRSWTVAPPAADPGTGSRSALDLPSALLPALPGPRPAAVTLSDAAEATDATEPAPAPGVRPAPGFWAGVVFGVGVLAVAAGAVLALR